MDKTSYRLLTLTVSCMLLLSTTAQQAIAWDCGPCDEVCENCEETGCEVDCILGYCCEDDYCQECPECDDCKSCNAVTCECESDCVAGQCCDDDDCVECPVCDDCKSCNAANCECECTSECCTDSDCGDPDCWDCVDCECECDITVNSVSSDDFACVDCDVEFTANVSGSCSCVDWSGGGDPATASGTCTFTTHWDSPGTKTVTASPDCGGSKQKQVTIVEVASLLPDVGTEFDDGDDNPDTKSFVVCAAATGVVTVTATPNPSVSEENLPDCWSLTGGTGSSKLTRTIDRTTASTTVITCTCNTSSKTTTIHVIDDLTVIPREACVCVNCTKDFSAWTCVGGNATDVTSSATFSTNNPGGSMKRTTGESTGPNNKILHPGSASASLNSDWVRASCGGDPTDAAHDCDLTVVQVVFSPDPLCVPVDGTASLTATVTPSSASSRVTFDTANGSIATVSGSAPNLTVHGVSAGNTQVRAKLGECVCETVDVSVCENPQFQSIGIQYIKPGYETHAFGTMFLDPPQFDDVLWDPSAGCWCTHYTSQGRKFEHCHFPVGFPFYYDIDGDGDDETITAADSRAWWEDVKYGSAYEFVSSATCERNCHGYATGKSFWFGGDEMGEYVLEDDYTELFGDDIVNATIMTKPKEGNPTHSVKITQWENGKIKETHEKYQEGPVYKRVYADPIEPPDDWRYWWIPN